jgi:uncharacterized membrane protein YcaP (DUF421 family)
MEYSFDLTRILLGSIETAHPVFYLEVILRTIVMYLYTIFLARMVGQGGIGQIGPFEFVLVIAVGSAAGDPMFYPDVGLLQGLLVITVVIVLHRATGFLFQRHKNLELTVEGNPLMVVREGKIREDVLGSGTLTERELLALLRLNGVRNIGEVECAFFEPNGRLSVFRYPARRRRKGRATIPKEAKPGN